MKSVNKQHTSPISVPKSLRNHPVDVVTSGPAGKVLPIATVELFRQDAARGRIRAAVEMLETHELIMNATMCRFTVWVVPNLALERFEGSREQFDRSYAGLPQYEGGDVVPYMTTATYGAPGSNPILKVLGEPYATGDQLNTCFVEMYNIIDKYRRINASEKLAHRLMNDTSLAPAHWNDSRFEHMVPDFDQAVIDGQFALRVVESKMPVTGIGFTGANQTPAASIGVRNAKGTTETYAQGYSVQSIEETAGAQKAQVAIKSNGFFPDVYAELAAEGITVSLSDIALARKTQWFAKLREKLQGLNKWVDDDHTIDLLMSGIEVPDLDNKLPFCIADTTVPFKQIKRYATDSANLAKSAVSGGAVVEFDLRVPELQTGGMIYILAECMPRQLWERQRNPYLHLEIDAETGLPVFPDYLRDALDPEKVEVVKNGDIDASHTDPDGTFAYDPLNAKWNRGRTRVGGKFHRPTAGGTIDTSRERFWAVEDVDPKFSENFKLVDDLPTYIFLNEEVDPFEFGVQGNVVIRGLTQFGGKLVEATDNYDKVMAKAPTARIEKEA